MEIKKILAGTLTASLLFMGACTDKFEEYNTNPIGVTDDILEGDNNSIGAYFPQIQQMIYCNFNWGWGKDWTFQIMQNLNADIFSGYMMTPTDFAANVNNTTYALVDGWNASAWDYTYTYMMPSVAKVYELAEEEAPQFYAIAKILRVTGMHRISDIYGPIIYSHYGESATGGKFDSQEDAYKAFIADLKDAVAILSNHIEEYPDDALFGQFDQAYKGDYVKWIRFANSLRLRLAVRMVKVDPVKAREEAESAMANEYGVIENRDEVFSISGKGYTHPLAAISGSWNDILMGAPIESIMTGYEDPRLSKYFKSSADADVKENGYTYKGIRQGIDIPGKSLYVEHSQVNLETESPAVLMTPAEVYFLRAEGALRGWSNMNGTAKELYELGISSSFNQWGVNMGDYLNSENLPAEYVDVKNADNNVAAGSEYLNNVSPKWDEAAISEVKLQKIITQKWIAMFPEGQEAWSEFRRTGYPKLFPVKKNDSQGVIPSELFVRRLNFSVTEKDRNPEGYAEAVKLLGGADNGATRLWWDVEGPNF